MTFKLCCESEMFIGFGKCAAQFAEDKPAKAELTPYDRFAAGRGMPQPAGHAAIRGMDCCDSQLHNAKASYSAVFFRSADRLGENTAQHWLSPNATHGTKPIPK